MGVLWPTTHMRMFSVMTGLVPDRVRSCCKFEVDAFSTRKQSGKDLSTACPVPVGRSLSKVIRRNTSTIDYIVRSIKIEGS
mmetsp:Transcript_26439/g.62110  ORF Transcript_26439/g.62110 Transcript_26439/m.62110 type:complete len:81 (-) Transcript_26439:139-381(-)